MKFIIFLALVALGSARTLFGTQKEISVDEDRIIVRGPQKTVFVEKIKDDDETGIQIMVKDQDGMVTTLKLDKDMTVRERYLFNGNDIPSESSEEDENFGMRTFFSDDDLLRYKRTDFIKMQVENYQMTILVNIFKNYEGIVDETTFKQLLQEIKRAVNRNELHPLIFDILRDLEATNTMSTPSFLRSWSLNKKEPMMEFWKTTERDIPTEFSNLYTTRDQQQTMDISDMRKFAELEDMTADIKSLLVSMEDYGLSTDVQKEFLNQIHIQEIQGYIMKYQLQAKQLQLNQQIIMIMKQQIRMQIMTGLQRGLQFMQKQKLYQVKGQLQQMEKVIMAKQLTLQLRILKLQRDLIREEQYLQQFLVNKERKMMISDDEVLGNMGMMTMNNI